MEVGYVVGRKILVLVFVARDYWLAGFLIFGGFGATIEMVMALFSPVAIVLIVDAVEFDSNGLVVQLHRFAHQDSQSHKFFGLVRSELLAILDRDLGIDDDVSPIESVHLIPVVRLDDKIARFKNSGH